MFYKLNIIRRLARSYRWQVLYRRAKDTNGFSLFNNHSNLSDIQILILQWSEIYYNLYQDISINRPFINNEIINDDIRTDAYLLIRDEVINSEHNPNTNKNKKKINSSILLGDSVIFRKG